MGRKAVTIISSATVLAFIGVTLTLLSIEPGSWTDNLRSWGEALSPVFPYIAGAGIGAATVTPVFMRRRNQGIEILTTHQYALEFRKHLQSKHLNSLKVFGYTGEVMSNDLFQYADRYRDDLTVRIIQRDWVVEQREEDQHNQRRSREGVRPWEKARSIRDFAIHNKSAPGIKAAIRYYKHQPIFTGCVLACEETGERVGYVGLLHWIENPKSGGSQFKSVPGYVIKLDPNNTAAKQLLDRLESQFDYEWKFGDDLEQVMKREFNSER